MIYYRDNHVKIFTKDCRQMDEITDGSVQCVVTSPPYWGLRKYSGEQELIWGNKECEHQWVTEVGDLHYNQGYGSTFFGNSMRKRTDKIQGTYQRSFCSLCGAWKGAYGLEPIPEMYIEHTIEILREIRRVLRKDGVVFWNIGDSYFATGKGPTPPTGIHSKTPVPTKGVYTHDILKPKDLCLIPFRVAIACQEDGWWVRSVIIWSKPNPMPESVTDRPTESHEYILMLTKSAKYYWDQDSVRTKFADATLSRVLYLTGMSGKVAYANENVFGYNAPQGKDYKHLLETGGANIRSVWEFPTQPYPEAHFAVFPEKLPEICIKAASRENDLILDPFMGAGTTLWVAKKLNRKAVGYELSEEYCQLSVERCRQQVMM